MKLVIASHNKGKIAEIGEMLAPLGITAVSAAEAGVDEPEETGHTFADNAALKAMHALEISGLASLADDSGLSVAALDGDPGVYSARWAPQKDFSVAFARIQKELAEADHEPTGTEAAFICVLALAVPGNDIEFFEGRVDGKLIFPPRGVQGFGYDPIFIPNGYDITFAEMDGEEKNRISHRGRAIAQFLEFMKEHA